VRGVGWPFRRKPEVVVLPLNDEQPWICLQVHNRGKPDTFQVEVEKLDCVTMESSSAYYAPWRDNDARELPLVRKQKGIANIAEIASSSTVSGLKMVELRFSSVEQDGGYFSWTVPVGSTITCGINVLRGKFKSIPGTYTLKIDSNGVQFARSD